MKYQIQKLNIQAKDNKIEIQLFSDFYLELLKFFKHLGKALGFAFEDIADKSKKYLNNQKIMLDLKEMTKEDHSYLHIEDFIDYEISHGIAFASGKNNSSVLKNHPHYGDYKNYISTSWNFIRGAWLFDFISEIFRLGY